MAIKIKDGNQKAYSGGYGCLVKHKGNDKIYLVLPSNANGFSSASTAVSPVHVKCICLTELSKESIIEHSKVYCELQSKDLIMYDGTVTIKNEK